MPDTTNSHKAWYLIYTKPRAENVAKENLERQGYTTYLPLMKTSRRRRGRYYTTVEAMFSRYLFVQLDTEYDNWMPIRSTLGVAKLVRFGQQPAVVPEILIEALYFNETDEGVQNRAPYQLQRGETVEIIEGPMVGLRGTLKRLLSNERVSLMLELIGKHMRVVLLRHDLQAVIG